MATDGHGWGEEKSEERGEKEGEARGGPEQTTTSVCICVHLWLDDEE
jgi:hypothetical protein